MAEAKRLTGTVKWFSAQKGFGFVTPDDGDEDLFVHQTSIRSEGFRTLSDGQQVEFSVDYDEDQRPKAVDVTALGRSTRSGGGRAGMRGRGGGYGGYGGGGYDGGGGGYVRGGRFGGRGGYGVPGRGGRFGGECYNCGRIGHLARDCYQGGGFRPTGAGGARRYGRGRGFGGGGVGACYNCGEEGHFARDCPHEQK